MALVLQHVGKLSGERGFTRTLQTRHEDNSRFVLKFQVYSLSTHELCQFVVHELHHELSRLDGRKHVHTQCLLLHRVGESLRHLVVYVGVEQCAAHVFQRFGNVDLGDFAFTLQYLKRSL